MLCWAPVAVEDVPGASGPVVALEPLVVGAQRRLLLVHAASPVVVWDLRCASLSAYWSLLGLQASMPMIVPTNDTGTTHQHVKITAPVSQQNAWTRRCQCVVAVAAMLGHEHGSARAADLDPEADAATCAAWVSERGDCFATGHVSGAVRVWGLPPAAMGVPPLLWVHQSTACHRGVPWHRHPLQTWHLAAGCT